MFRTAPACRSRSRGCAGDAGRRAPIAQAPGCAPARRRAARAAPHLLPLPDPPPQLLHRREGVRPARPDPARGRLGARHRRERGPLHLAHGRAGGGGRARQRPGTPPRPLRGPAAPLTPPPPPSALLTKTARHSGHANVSLLNCAASERTAVVGMEIPRFPDGLENYYQAHVVSGVAGLSILALSIDSLALPAVRLVKIDAEGHEFPVLQGMRRLVERDHPVLIVETRTGETTRLLESWGYGVARLAGC